MILSRDEAKMAISSWLDTSEKIESVRADDAAIDDLLDILYPTPSDVVVVPLKKLEQVAGLLHQGTIKLLMHSDLATVDMIHNERDRQLGPYLRERELYFLKSALVHNAWTARWLVMNAKENPT